MIDLQGFTFEPPAGFRTEEMTVGLRFGSGGGPAPSLLVQSKPAKPQATLEELTGQIMAELVQSVEGIKNLTKGELTFKDGGIGAVLAFDFPSGGGELRQYFVLRLEKARLCTLTLTVPRAGLNEANAKTYIDAISQLKAE